MRRKRVDVEPDNFVTGRALSPQTAYVIFTDLDGTLLDSRNYSFDDAREGLEAIRHSGIPCILCSSKTQAEIEKLRRELAVEDPFISENGGGIFIPPGYFPATIEEKFPPIEEKFFVIRLGARYSDLRQAIREARSEGYNVIGFGDMSHKEIAAITGLSEENARLAAMRNFDEPFIFRGQEEDRQRLLRRMRSKGFSITRASGTFYHIMGDSDKGKAVAILTDLYRSTRSAVITIGIGEAPNDLHMLREVDIPIIVKRPDGLYDALLEAENFRKADGIGPKGWNRAILEILRNSGNNPPDKTT